MQNRTLSIVVASVAIVLTLGYFLFHSSRATAITNYLSSGTDLIAFGDSLVTGSGATEGNDFVSVLSRKIGRTIVNLGVPGNTTAQGLARIGELDQYHPKVVLLLLGGNDHLQKVPSEATFANLAQLIQGIQARGAIVLLLGIKGSLFGDQFAPQFEKLRDTYHTAYVSNVLDGLFGKTQYMADEVHPNDAGNALIAERIYPTLLSLLK